MIAPITNEEKQKLLEAISFDNKVETLESIISFYFMRRILIIIQFNKSGRSFIH